MDDRGTPINNCPMIGSEDIDLYRLFRAVYKLGGYNRVTNQNQWKVITRRLSFAMQNSPSTHNLVKQAYKKFLHSFEDFYRKLGCTMVNHPRSGTRKQRPGRSLIRDKDRNTPIPPQVPAIKGDKDEEDKKNVEDEKKEKKEIKKEQVKEEEVVKVKKKEELEEHDSGQESDLNIEGEVELSNNEKSQKPTMQTVSPGITTSSNRVKSKSKEDTKKKVIEKKKAENKKQEKKDDKPKEEEAAKTRSKAKDDIVKNKSASEARETRTPSREAERRTLPKQRRLTDEELKKRGRRRKEFETEKSRTDDITENAPSYKGPIDFGDRLKVYYGPTHESKVTYEAKVIDIEKDGPEPMYLVHYTGWNTRYDEWIKASRIAQNFTQTQSRVKRSKTTPRPQTPSTNLSNIINKSKGFCNSTVNASQSRRRAQSVAPTTSSSVSSTSVKEIKKEEKEVTQLTRCTTPLPIASCSSRTKSPATPANRQTRTTRNTEVSGVEHRRRTRRMSGHTDISVASETEDSEVYESDTTEPEQTKTRLRGIEEKKRKETRSKFEERIKTVDVSDGEYDKDNLEELRKSRRLRRTPGKFQGTKSEPNSDEEQPKGRDFDLNQIRSELKGFNKAVKLELLRRDPDPEDEIKSEEKENIALTSSPNVEKHTASPKVESIVETKVENTEDIYEFKEPEPFEFEVRNKRDTSGEKDKLKKRMFEEDPKSPKKKQKVSISTAAKEAKCETDNDSRKKARKLFGKKSDDANEVMAVPFSRSSQSTSSTCGDAFDKLCESPSFNQVKPAAIAEESPAAPSTLNLLFNDLPADDEATHDDSEGRLIISESEISEIEQETLFNYQQEILNSTELATTVELDKNEPDIPIECANCGREEVEDIDNAIPKGKQSHLEHKQNIKIPTVAGQNSELRVLDSKLLDIASIPSPIVTPPAPISARLPATSTIEEKLSAAAMAFRNKAKDIKKDEGTSEMARKIIKESWKRLDTNIQKSKDDHSISITEIYNKKTEKEELVITEEKQCKEVLRAIVKQKEDEVQSLKLKNEIELKKFTETKTVIEHKTKLQEVKEAWNTMENEGNRISGRSQNDCKETDRKEKDSIENRKKLINDIIDSTDSSDSEQRLVIDNEELQDVKASTSNFDVKLRSELDRLQDTQEKYVRTDIIKITQNIEHRHQQQEERIECKTDVTTVPKTDEEGEAINSLLCEEEIPGSPAPLSDNIEQTNSDSLRTPPKNEITENNIVLMEMPFASAPTSGQSTSSSTVATLSMALPKTVETSVPTSMQQQQQNITSSVRQQQQQHASALMPPQRRESNEAAPVMDNTPPTTPDSSISNITGSPREERIGSSPISEDNIKLNRDSSEADNDSAGKGPGFSEDDTLPNSESNSADRTLKPPAKRTIEDIQLAKKRKRNRKHSESTSSVTKKPGKQNGRQGKYGAGSDSDDTSEGSNLCGVNTISTTHTNITSVIELNTYSSRSPRPTKYNFYVELGMLNTFIRK